ncbi:MAG: restriction endonuclease subunit S [Verrucomicrobiales bacterium]
MSADTSFSQPELPADWREVRLGSVTDIRFSSVDKLTIPSEKPVRLCNYTDVYNNDALTADMEFMRASATPAEIERFGVQVGDVIITKDSETPDDIGIAAVIDSAAPDMVCGYHLALIRPDKDEVEPAFLAKQLADHRIARYFGKKANGLTRYGLPTGVVADTLVWLPHLDTQREISRILRMVDEAIAKTEAVIAKLKQGRAGLLHDLLTRGLDENGQLRDPIAHPEQFQDSPLGRIPGEWEVASIESLLAPVPNAMRSGPFGSSLLKQELKESGIPLLGIDNVHVERFVDAYTRFVDHAKFQELKRYSVSPLDIMITIMGTVGRCCVVPETVGTALSSKHVWTISLDRTRYSPYLACWQINHAFWALRQLRVDEQGGVMTAIRSETLRRLLLPVPTYQETIAIEKLLLEQTRRIASEEAELAKLNSVKSGLMTDLLTGRVRVPENILAATQ